MNDVIKPAKLRCKERPFQVEGTEKYKGPEVGMILGELEDRMRAANLETYWLRERMVVDEVRKAARARSLRATRNH